MLSAVGMLLLAATCHADPTLGADAPAAEPPPAREVLLDRALELIAQGDAQFEANALDPAGRAYGQALQIMGRIIESHPDWQTARLAERIAYCDERIERIVGAILAAPAPGPAAEAEPPSNEPRLLLPEDIEALGEELDAPDRVPGDDAAPVVAADVPPQDTDPLGIASGDTPAPDRAPAAETQPEPRHRGGLFGWLRGDDDESDDEAAGDDGPASTGPRVVVDVVEPPGENTTEPGDVPTPTPAPAPAVTAAVPPVTTAELMDADFLLEATLRMVRENAPAQARDLLLEHKLGGVWNAALERTLGIAYCRTGDFEAAAELAKTAIRNDNGDAQAHVLLGTAYLAQGDIDIARDQMLMAIEIDPALPEAHYNLARLLVGVDPPNLQAAQWHYRKARALGTPTDPGLERMLQRAR